MVGGFALGGWRELAADEPVLPGTLPYFDAATGKRYVHESQMQNGAAKPGPMPTAVKLALDIAARGLPVFPCGANKKPAIPKAKGGNGFHDASTDPDRIRELWDLAGPAAQLIGVPTGHASGFDVLDIDPRHGGDRWKIEHSDRLGETRIHGTPGLPKAPTDPVMPGEHWLFVHVDGVRNIQDGKTIAPGIDVRGQGGYVCFPPSGGYRVIHGADIAKWPDWLLPLVLKASEPAPRPEPSSYATPAKISDNRLRGFIGREVHRVRDAPIGARHGARLSAARSIGGIAAEAGLSDTEVEEMLIAARPPEVEEEKERRTIRAGLAYGRIEPIDLNTLPDSALFRRHWQHRGNGAAVPEPGSASGAQPKPEPKMPEPDGEGEQQPDPAGNQDTGPAPVPNATEPPPDADADAEIKRLAALPRLNYERERSAIAKLLHIRTARLDKLVEQERTSAAAPSPAGLQPDSPEVTKLITEFNHKYFVLNENGRAIIYAPKRDPILNRRFFERLTFADLDRLYSNRVVKIGETRGEPVFAPVADVWLHHRNRKQFIGGMVFDPSPRRQPTDVLNLWQGFAVTPRAGSWQLLREHIGTIICNGNTELFDYLLEWMADLLQQPGKQGEVCVVLCGPEGTGKGILARAIKYLLGQHALAISNSKHLTGNFNAHLRDVVFLFADEAFHAGDKAHVGVLKSLITEPYLTIEGKYQNAVQVPNYLHILMASNEMWVVPASLRSRRWLVLDVDDSHANDHNYFAAIQTELEHGGYEAMLHELLERPPVGNLRKIPVTPALQTQRKLSLATNENWWFDCLHRGFVFRSKLGLENHFGKWHEVLATDLLAESYAEFCRAHHERRPLSRELLGVWLRTMGCKPARPRDEVVGEHIGEVTTPEGHTHRVAELVRQDRARGYHLGSLDAAREAFTRVTGLAVEWDG